MDIVSGGVLKGRKVYLYSQISGTEFGYKKELKDYVAKRKAGRETTPDAPV